jgi:hypothetical protein
MNANTIKCTDRVVDIPQSATAKKNKQVRYANDSAVEKAHKRAIHKFAGMFRKLAQ